MSTNELSTTALIAMQEARAAIKESDGLEDRLRAAMRMTRQHWLATKEDDQFKAAIGAVLLSYGEGSPERERIAWEARQLGKISAIQHAAMAGVAVQLDDLTFDVGEYEPIGLLAMWRGER